jgi:hypothetical protein
MNPAQIRQQLRRVRNTRPTTHDHLWDWVYAYTGIRIARDQVCQDHSPPFEWFAQQWLERPDQILICGSRGSGKSFLQALLTHLESRFTPKMGTRILGGAASQAMQIFEALTSGIIDGRGPGGSDADAISRLLTDKAVYRNGSKVSILAASETSVRGPHVPTLRLDEVDEIKPSLRESSLGMCMDIRGISAAISMTSTFHRVAGPMAELVKKGKAGEFPFHTTCTFDVLQRCPESRSGPYVGGRDGYLLCPQCPIQLWCHAERDRNGDIPLAKIADGHYSISALIQKARNASPRTFAADYLCAGPRPEGIWFTGFDPALHVSVDAEFDPALDVHLSVDSGVSTGAVFFQVVGHGPDPMVHVICDHYAEGLVAETNARMLIGLAGSWCNGRAEVVSTDSAGGARNPVGPTVIAEYERAGLVGRYGQIERWPVGSVADSLALLDGLISPSVGEPRLLIHPRCTRLITALSNYRRATRRGQLQDFPEDPQHPHEDLVDALRGGLKVALPDGRAELPHFTRVPLSTLRF